MLRKIGNLLHNNNHFSKLVDQTIKLKKLSFVFQSMLESDFREHCQLARIDNEELIVVVDNTVWAMKFRYLIPELLKTLKTQVEFKKIIKIRYQIATFENPHNKNVLSKDVVKNKIFLSAQNANLILETAQLIKNTNLRNKLEKLAENGAK